MNVSLAILLILSIYIKPCLSFSSAGLSLPKLSQTTHRSNSSFEYRVRVPDNKKLQPLANTVSTNDSKCVITKFSNKITNAISWFDENIMNRILRLASHAPAILSQAYFGLIAMASMMGTGPMVSQAGTVAEATIASVLTKSVGPTTNTVFANLFPTLVTPASFVFLVWPVIAVLQLVTVVISALYQGSDEFLSQNDLSTLTLANICSSLWLLISSTAAPGYLPIGSFLILPLVPLFSGYPLRNNPKYMLPAFQLYFSFTTIASFLAFAVELQYGGRIPIIGKVSEEIAASVFLMLYSGASLSVRKKSLVKRVVNFGALSGILFKRFAGITLGTLSPLLLSISFWGTVGVWGWSVKSLFFTQSD